MTILDPTFAYGHFAPDAYERLHKRFLRFAGGEGQSAAEGAIAALLRPGLRVLDAGCGTGRLARRLLGMEPDLQLALIDCSPRLLAASRDLPVRRLFGDITNIAVSDRQFDLTLGLWSVEATADPMKAVTELVRATRPGGHICLLFCARREDSGIVGRMLEMSVGWRKTGRFLDPDAILSALRDAGANSVRTLSCAGPAMALLARKGDTQ